MAAGQESPLRGVEIVQIKTGLFAWKTAIAIGYHAAGAHKGKHALVNVEGLERMDIDLSKYKVVREQQMARSGTRGSAGV